MVVAKLITAEIKGSVELHKGTLKIRKKKKQKKQNASLNGDLL